MRRLIMETKFRVNNIEDFDKLLKSTAVEVTKLMTSPPTELVPVRSKAGGFVMTKRRVDANEIYKFIED
jgi:hypothetical protein